MKQGRVLVNAALFIIIFAFPFFFSLPARAAISEEACLKDRDCVAYYKELGDDFEILRLLRNNYVDELNFSDLVGIYRKSGIKGVFSSLDPHSAFYTAEEAEKEAAKRPNVPFGGIGMVVREDDKKIVVAEIIDGGPASKSDLKEGDVIAEICTTICKAISGLKGEEAVLLIRGEPGTEVTLKLERNGVDHLIVVTLKRAIIKTENVTAKVFKEYGYLKLNIFEGNSQDAVYLAILNFKAAGLKGIVFDMRGNPGGLLTEARMISALFLDDDKLIDKIKTRKGIETGVSAYFKSFLKSTTVFPMVVLVNGGSASGSEIFAAAMQDHGRAVIIGTPTFGKASMQSVYGSIKNDYWNVLAKGGYFKFTTGRIYRPNGRSLQGKGIIPDFIVSQKSSAEVEKMMEGAFEKKLAKHLSGDEEGVVTAEEESKINLLKRDYQLEVGLEILKVINRGN